MMHAKIPFLNPLSKNPSPMYQLVLLSALSGLLLVVPYLLPEAYFLSWFALVPILIAIEQLQYHPKQLLKVYFLGLVCGFVSYVCGTYWITDFLILFKSYAGVQGFLVSCAFWIYCAQLPALLFVSFSWLRRTVLVHEFLLFPLLLIAFYTAFPMVLMPQLGESQSEFLVAIQATEFFGVQGLDGLIALANIFIVHLILAKSRKAPFAVAIVLISLWFSYGIYANISWQKRIASWDSVRIGIVQANDAPSLRAINSHLGYSRAYPPEMEMTERLTIAGAELVVWPESRYKNYFDSKDIKQSFIRSVKQMQSNLIFQDLENTQSPDGNKRFNSVVFIARDGKQAPPYRKNIRVPFGEYMPEFQSAPFLTSWLRKALGEFNSEISPGNGPVSFSVEGKKIIPLICYETLFPSFVAEAVSSNGRGSILLGLSNDSWFGETLQAGQHLNASKLRAVENRLPFILALNGGPSLVVMPNGEVLFQTDAFQAGGYLVDMPYSENSGGSFFSRHPYLFLYTIYCLLGVIILLAAIKTLSLSFINKNKNINK